MVFGETGTGKEVLAQSILTRLRLTAPKEPACYVGAIINGFIRHH